jgi:peptide/nickel transport system permease protein
VLNWRRFFAHKQNWLGLILVTFFIFVALAAPWLAPPPDPEAPGYLEIKSTFYQLPDPPREGSPLGSVPRPPISGPGVPVGEGPSYQWDIYHSLVWGARAALIFGLAVTGITAVFGIIIGASSAYIGGWAESFLMRITDAFLAFPIIAAIWLLEQSFFSYNLSPFSRPLTFFFGSELELTLLQQFFIRFNIDSVMLALVLFSWMPYARLVNAAVNRQKSAEYVMAAKAMGASGLRILSRHLMPNSISSAVVLATRDVGAMVILAAAFTFIGMGGTTLPWGLVLVGGRNYILGLGGNPFAYWWVFVPISLALILFSVGWNLLGDGFNDLLNPRRPH